MGGLVTGNFELDYLPDPTDQRVRWALAFYREGMALERDNVAYATLSYFKILNIVANTGRLQKEWINANVADFGTNNHIKFELRRRVTELTQSGTTDIGAYLYGSGRCAVAHAGVNPTVDPEDPDDIERLYNDITLIRAMAAHVIEKELGIKTQYSVWTEHLYELAGFKQLFGSTITDRLKAQDATLTVCDITPPPRLRVGIQNKEPYAALDNLSVPNTAIVEGKFNLTISSDDGLVEIDLTLSFPEERMLFDVGNGIRVADDGSERSARQIISVYKFLSDYYGNGKLQIFNAETGHLLGRKDAFIPVNIVPGFAAEHFGQLINKYEAEAETRAANAQKAPAGT
jgi:hypothetical protein